MEDGTEAWFRRQTSHWRDWPIEQLMRWKRSSNTRISVVIPARNEQATVGAVAGAVARASMRERCLVDELVVMDSDSTDGTAEAAARAGATVYGCRDVAPGLGAHPGQGEALYKISGGQAGGGRVTELVARPLLNLWWPQLAARQGGTMPVRPPRRGAAPGATAGTVRRAGSGALSD